jgi:copper chaperone CopZ
LSPWLGPDADNEAIQLGLTTLRTWWQHRRKGESGSAVAALGTEKMKGVVEGYTRHFFTLAHCIVVNDRVQPPKGLFDRMKELEKKRAKENKSKNNRGADNIESSDAVSAIRADLTDPNLSPLEKLHLAQRRQRENSGFDLTSSLNGISTGSGFEGTGIGAAPILPSMQGKCIPGKVDLPGILDAVNHQATQLAHRGFTPNEVISGSTDGIDGQGQQPFYGDPHTTPVVFVSSTGDIQIALKVEGITCAHCVKIVETVLRGCNGNKSPINGLLDAAADEKLGRVILKIDEAAAAKRIAFEAARNLNMVGYSADSLSMSIVGSGSDPVAHADLGALATAFEVVAATESTDVFDWTIPCTCPDNGIIRGDCARYVMSCCSWNAKCTLRDVKFLNK